MPFDIKTGRLTKPKSPLNRFKISPAIEAETFFRVRVVSTCILNCVNGILL